MTSELKLDEGTDAVVVKGGMKVAFNASGIIVNVQGATITVDKNGTVAMQTAANETASQATLEIGVRELGGDHVDEIYGGIFPDGKPGWILEAPKPMTHYEACELKGRALPTSEEGKYLDSIRSKGELKGIFARHSDGSSSAGHFWLAEHASNYARYQQFSDGSQTSYDYDRDTPLPVLCVKR